MWLTETNAFSISTVTKNPSLFKTSLISRRSGITLPTSLIIYFLYPFWLEDIISGKTFLRRSSKVLEINFTSQFSKEIGRQFDIYLLSHTFFLINFITAFFCNAYIVVLQERLFSVKKLYKTLSLAHYFLMIYYFPHFVMHWTVLF